MPFFLSSMRLDVDGGPSRARHATQVQANGRKMPCGHFATKLPPTASYGVPEVCDTGLELDSALPTR